MKHQKVTKYVLFDNIYCTYWGDDDIAMTPFDAVQFDTEAEAQEVRKHLHPKKEFVVVKVVLSVRKWKVV